MSSPLQCSFCHKADTFEVDTYKHLWSICPSCGCATSTKKEYHPLVENFPFDILTAQELPRKEEMISMLLGDQNIQEDNASIYDYFVSDMHIEYSIKSTKPFLEDIITKHQIEIKDKKILDISGGNGHFINEFKKLGADVTLTEFNPKAVEYAQSTLELDAYLYDFNQDDIASILPNKKFDIVFLRAAVMFCNDLEKFLQQLKPILAKDAVIIYSQSVVPTLGVMMRTQFDEYNYHHLYQPEILQTLHQKHGYTPLIIESDPDQEMYVYDLDKFTLLRNLISSYEQKALEAFPYKTPYSFRARDRRRYTLIFKAPA